MTEPSYQTVPLEHCSDSYLKVAQKILLGVEGALGSSHIRRETGSFSIIPRSTHERIAKVIIHESRLGRRMGDWSNFFLQDGVYVLVRAHGPANQSVESSWLPIVYRRFFERLDKARTLGIAPNYRERFHYFPVMAGEDLSEISEFLAACGHC